MLACQRWLRPQTLNFLKFYPDNQRVYVQKIIRRSVANSYGASMRAWVINQYGTNDVLAFSDNHPAPCVNFAHEVVVQVHAVSLNPLDIAMRGGYGAGVLRLRRDPRTLLQNGAEFPLVLGRDVSGVVLQCGSGVKHVQEGDEVWASIPPWQQGSLAECVLLNGSDVSLKPKSLSHIEAASIPYVAATAWSALVNTGGLHSDNCSKKRILVHGASGGVGTLAIQLLKAWGGHVTATCFQDAVGLLKELRADDVIDCTAGDAASQLRTRQKFDLILDNVGGETESWAMDLMKPWAGAKFVTLVSPLLRNTDALGLVDGVLRSGMTLHDKAIRSVAKGVFYRWAFYVPDGVALDRIGQLVSSGKIRPVIEATFPFSQVPEAFHKVETGQARGKTVIAIATQETESSFASSSFSSASPSSTHSDSHSSVNATHSKAHTHAEGGFVTSLLAEEEGHTAEAVARSPVASEETSPPSPAPPSTQEMMKAGRPEAGESVEAVEKDQVEAVEKDQIEAVESHLVEAVEKDQIEAVEKDQIQAVEKDQIEAIKKDQIQAVEKDQIEAVKKEQVEATTTTDDSDSSDSSDDSDEEPSEAALAEAAQGHQESSTSTTTSTVSTHPTADTAITDTSPEGPGAGSIGTADSTQINANNTGSTQATADSTKTTDSADHALATGSTQPTDNTLTTPTGWTQHTDMTDNVDTSETESTQVTDNTGTTASGSTQVTDSTHAKQKDGE